MSFDLFLKLNSEESKKDGQDMIYKIKTRPMKRKGEKEINLKPKRVISAFTKEFDFLKRIHIAEINAIEKYKLLRKDLLVLYILYSEDVFSSATFYTLTNHVRKQKSIQSYVRQGLLMEIDTTPYDYVSTHGNQKTIKKMYKMTFKAMHIVSYIYGKVLLKNELKPCLDKKLDDVVEALNIRRLQAIGKGIDVKDNEKYIEELKRKV